MRFHARLARSTILLVALFAFTATAASAQGNPLAQPTQGAAPFAGVFENEQMRVELRSEGGRYTGTIRYGGQEFPATARSEGNELTGSFQASGQSFNFTARLDGDTLRLETGGATHVLRKSVPANPLAQPGPAPASAGAGVAAPAPAGPVHKSAMGISFVIPEGWGAADNAAGASLLPPGASANPAQPAGESYTIFGTTDYDDPADPELLQEMMTTLENLGIQSARQTAKDRFRGGKGDGVIYTIDGTNAKQNRPMRVRIYAAPTNEAVLFLVATGDAARVDQNDRAMRRVAASLAYDASAAQQTTEFGQQAQGSPGMQGGGAQTPGMGQQGGLTDGNPQSQQWLQGLAGKLLTQLSSYSSGSSGGYSSRKRLYLSPDGTFQYSGSSSVSVDTGGAFGNSAGGDSATGRWRLATQGGVTFLIMNLQSGEVWQLRLDYQQGATYVDGVRTYVTNPDGS